MARKRYQTGTLILRGRTWVGRWREDIVELDGKIRRVRRSQVLGDKKELPTRKLAQRRLDTILGTINAPSYRPGRIATLEEFTARWVIDILPNQKQSTQRSVQSNLRTYILPRLGKLKLDEIGRQRVQSFVTQLYRQGLSKKTILNAVGTLSSIVGCAESWGFVCQPVHQRHLVISSDREKTEAATFTAEQVRNILALAKEPFATMFAVAAMTGIRSGEIAGLKVSDLDFEAGTIRIARSAWGRKLQTPKSEKSAGVLPMPGALAARMRIYLQNYNPQDILFPGPKGAVRSMNNFPRRTLWPILDRLWIPRCGLHAFRHFHTSQLLEVGATPAVTQKQLRHSDPRVTLGVYGHVVGDAQRVAVNQVADILDPNGPMENDNLRVVH